MKVITPWTRSEENKLIMLCNRFNIEACAVVLGRTYGSIKNKMSELGVKSVFNNKGLGNARQFYAEAVANMMELENQGFSADDIANCFNSNFRTISVTMNRAKIKGFGAYPKRPDNE